MIVNRPKGHPKSGGKKSFAAIGAEAITECLDETLGEIYGMGMYVCGIEMKTEHNVFGDNVTMVDIEYGP